MTMTWSDGRRLGSVTSADGETYSYTYNESGIRTKKTVNGGTTEYTLNGTNIISETLSTGEKLYFFYDEKGSPVAFNYYAAGSDARTTYYLVKNIQGDVTSIVNSYGQTVATYTYDTWGKLLSITGTLSDTIGEINPYRYRSYLYDTETGFYYLNSRYYDPVTGRFVNADGYVSTGQGILGYNMFAYCGNNPVCRADTTGEFWITALVVIAVVAVCTFTLSGCSSSNKKAPVQEPYSNQANCYAYAMKLENDPRTGQPFIKKPQPGEFSGNGLTARDLKGNSETVKKAINTKVSADAKVLNLNYTEVKSADHVPKAGNWVVALAYATDGSDYHWWRKNEDGTWSHKPGLTPIIHWDASGNTITDPGNCNRGIYDAFLGYYEVGPN